MPDREKVIADIEEQIAWIRDNDFHKFPGWWHSVLAMKDALALLKEHEAVEPYQHDAVWLCGNCEKEVVGWTDDITGEDIRYPFCRQCGRSMKWE